MWYKTNFGCEVWVENKRVGNIVYRNDKPCVITSVNHIQQTVVLVYLVDKITVNYFTLYIAFKSGGLPISALKADLIALGISQRNILDYAEWLSWNSGSTITSEEHIAFQSKYGYYDDYCKTIREMVRVAGL